MIRYIVKRLLSVIPVLLGVTVLTFFLMRLAPGDAAQTKVASMGLEPTKESIEMVRDRLGLDKPVPVQYAIWLMDVMRLEFGNSVVTNAPVLEEFAARIRHTVLLAVVSMLASIIIAFPAGVLSAMHTGRLTDNISGGVSILIMSVPSFCSGLLFILVFSVKLKWLPSFGYGEIKHIILPALAITTGMSAYYTRLIRAALLEELSGDYIKAARARGAGVFTLVFSHGLKNAVIPIVTGLGMSLGSLLGGAAVVEKIFSWPGVGKYLIDSIFKRDYAVIQSYVFFLAVAVLIINLAVDIACMFLDPKIRKGIERKPV